MQVQDPNLPKAPPINAPTAQPRVKTAIRMEADKSLKPRSWKYRVKKTIAFQGIEPTMPYERIAT